MAALSGGCSAATHHGSHLAVSAQAGAEVRRAATSEPTRALPCREAVGDVAPERELRVVLGVVALPASPQMRHALGTSRSGRHLFAKWGLSVRAGARLRLIVPPRLRGRVAIGWGNADEGHVGADIAVDRCRDGDARWVDFAGGYWVRKPICAGLIVSKGEQRRRVEIGIGRPCPGQLPPP